MGTVYKPTYTKPLPDSAEIITQKGETFARVKPEKGRTRTYPVRAGRDGSLRIVVTSATYVAKFRDGVGIIRKVSTGCREEATARSVLNELERRAELVKSGVVTQAEDRTANQQSRPLTEHFGDFRESMLGKQRDDTHCRTTLRYLERLADACHWSFLRDITRDSLEKWQSASVKAETSARTRNAFQTALVSFCNWCVETQRLTVNPIAKLPKANETTDRRRQRRAMTEDQLCRLLEVTRKRPLEEAMTIRRGSCKGERSANVTPETASRLLETGRERALIYKTLLLTGLRKGELKSLAIDQVELDETTPFLILDPADEKNRQGSDIPLRADLAADLREWINHKQSTFCGPNELFRQKPLFNVPTGLLRILNRDLEAAGIPKRDERGRTIDVHALRTTFGTLLSKGGVAPRTAQAAMRHSDISLTMGVYTDPKLLDVHGAMDVLPNLPLTGTIVEEPTTIRLTGTSGIGQLVPLLVPATVHTGHSGTSTVTLSISDDTFDASGPFDVTSMPVNENGSLTTAVNEPFKSGRQDLNLRPLDPQSSALPS